MSLYRIRVKYKGKDKTTNDVTSTISVFKYKDIVRSQVEPGTFTNFNDMLGEVFTRVIEPNNSPIYYYEFVSIGDVDLSTRIEEGIKKLVDNIGPYLERMQKEKTLRSVFGEE